MKKIILPVLCFAVSALLLIGCSEPSGGGPGTNNSGMTLTDKTLTLTVGETHTLTIANQSGNGELQWSSSDNAIAAVDNSGLVSAVSRGDAVITVSQGSASATCAVTVENRLEFENESIQVRPDGTANIADILDYTPLSGESFTWESSDPDVAAVDSDGNVVAGSAEGSATITVTYGGQSVELTVNVQSLAFDSVQYLIEKDDVLDLSAHLDYSDAGGAPEWSSSDPAVAHIDSSGSVSALSAGSVTIAARYNGKDASCTLHVLSASFASADYTVYMGDTLDLAAELSYNAVNGPVLEWNSSNDSAATIDDSGLLTPVAAGSATVSLTYGAASAACDISVLQASMAFNADNFTILDDETLNLADSLTYDGVPGASLVWESSDPSIAVSSSGELTVAIGATTITVRLEKNGAVLARAECAVTIGDSQGGNITVTISGPTTIKTHDTVTLELSGDILSEGLILPGSSGLTVNAPAGYDDYDWYLDGQRLNGHTSDTLTLPISKISSGRHTLSLVITDDNGDQYSAPDYSFIHIKTEYDWGLIPIGLTITSDLPDHNI